MELIWPYSTSVATHCTLAVSKANCRKQNLESPFSFSLFIGLLAGLSERFTKVCVVRVGDVGVKVVVFFPIAYIMLLPFRTCVQVECVNGDPASMVLCVRAWAHSSVPVCNQ